MAFRENLKCELEYQDIKVKELAILCGISRRTLDQYLSTSAKMPSAENAVKIANALNVSVEFLVTGGNFSVKNHKTKDSEDNKNIIQKKYHSLIEKCEKLTQVQIKLLEKIADNFVK